MIFIDAEPQENSIFPNLELFQRVPFHTRKVNDLANPKSQVDTVLGFPKTQICQIQKHRYAKTENTDSYCSGFCKITGGPCFSAENPSVQQAARVSIARVELCGIGAE